VIEISLDLYINYNFDFLDLHNDFSRLILVFEINKGKNAQKVKKITIIYHYLLEEDSNGQVCGGVLPQNIFEI
jgi:hypothetical protein